jgi:transcriptional regulator with XRE-family HTH domain
MPALPLIANHADVPAITGKPRLAFAPVLIYPWDTAKAKIRRISSPAETKQKGTAMAKLPQNSRLKVKQIVKQNFLGGSAGAENTPKNKWQRVDSNRRPRAYETQNQLQLLNSLGVTQISELSKLSKAYISQVKHGNRPPSKRLLEALANYTGRPRTGLGSDLVTHQAGKFANSPCITFRYNSILLLAPSLL